MTSENVKTCKNLQHVFSVYFQKDFDLCFLDDDEGYTITEPGYYFFRTTTPCNNWIQSSLYFSPFHLCLKKISKPVKINALGQLVELKP